MMPDDEGGMSREDVRLATESLAADYLAQIRARANDLLAWRSADMVGFEARLYAKWREPLDLFNLIRYIFQEATEIFDVKNRAQAEEKQDFMFEAMLRLCVRACKTSGEIHCLLRGGYADGAWARWRSLHELAATAMFIQKAGAETAERYVHWEVIEDWQSASAINDPSSGGEPLDAEIMANLTRARGELLVRYGKEFGQGYGWAFEAVRKLDTSFNSTRLGFNQLEKLCGMQHRRLDYKSACMPIHAGPKSGRFSLESPGPGYAIAVSPSNFGLDAAGSAAPLSLLQLLSSLTIFNADLEIYLRMTAVEVLVEEAQQQFSATRARIQKEESATVSLNNEIGSSPSEDDDRLKQTP